MNEDDEALFCGAATLPATATGTMMFMPAGVQQITPFAGAGGQQVKVLVDAAGATELEKQRAALVARGARPYFDFEHDDKGASFWVESFFWAESPTPGIYARGEWSEEGKRGVEGKKWRQFSPVFHVDNKRGNPARIVARDFAKPNMGGLVNDPAFKQISPLWAKNAGGAHPSNQHENTDNMDPKELAALQAKNKELETELASLRGEQASLKAKNENDALVLARISAKESEIKANAATLELEGLKAKNAEQGAELLKQREANAKAIVKAAVDRGAIAAKDSATIAAWEKDITDSPERGALLAKMGGNPALGGRVSPTMPEGRIVVTVTAATDAIAAYGALLAKNRDMPLTPATAEAKAQLAEQAAAIFAADLSKVDLTGAIMAADSTSDNLGVLTGALAMQAALPALIRNKPLLGSISTDFSAEPGLYGRTDNTRVVLRPAVQTYSATPGTDGRPQGWTTASDARTVDVPVTLDQYFAVPIVFGVTTIGATGRKLFDEQAPQAISAMGDYLINLLTANITAANFNAFAGSTMAAGATTSGSKTVTVTSTANAWVGAEITGTGIAAGTFVAAVVNGTTLTLSKNATATNTGLTLTVSSQGVVTTAMAAYVKALASFAVADLDTMAAIMDNNNVPLDDRFAILRPDYYRKLGSDSAVNALMQGSGDVSYLSERRLPKMSNFELLNAPYMPTGSNRQGFVGHKASLVAKTRLPMDLSTAIPGTPVPGSVATITDPQSGVSMALVSYYNMQGGFAEWRPELMAGVAVGDRRAGLLITSA